MKKQFLFIFCLMLFSTLASAKDPYSEYDYTQSQTLTFYHYKNAEGKKDFFIARYPQSLPPELKEEFTPKKSECWIDYQGRSNCVPDRK